MTRFVSNKPGVSYPVAWKPQAAVESQSIVQRILSLKTPAAGRVSDQALSDLFDHLATLMASGIPLLRALDLARSSTANQALLQAVERIVKKVRGGYVFSEALQEDTAIFSAAVRGMIRAAEASGLMDQVLKEIAESYARRAEMRGRVMQALAYPLIILCFGVLTIFVLIGFVIPKLAPVFELWDASLPWMTRILLAASAFLSKGGWIILLGILAGGFFGVRYLMRTRGSLWISKKLNNLPLFSRMFFLINFTRLTRTWGMLLRSGVPILDALRYGREVLEHAGLAESVNRILEAATRGSRLEDAIAAETLFPRLAKDFLSIGEETGTLAQSFDKVADYYERELNKYLKVMTALLEPALILLIGVVVGGLVISLLLPIFEMSLVVD